MNFEFATATRIIFGAGRLAEVGAIIGALGGRVLTVIGRSPAAARRAAPLMSALNERGIEAVAFAFEGEPTFDVVRTGTQQARENGCDCVVAFGGGSVIDAGKAIAMLLTNGGDPLDYAEVIGKGAPVTKPSAPFIAIPTTAGTGSEVTRNAVLGSPEHKAKVSLRSLLMLPRVALVDPELTYGLPPEITASTGLDALTQLIEPFVSIRANPLTDAICREGMRRVARSLQRACKEGTDIEARQDMALASLFGGLALANAGLGAAHGFAAAIGGMFLAPHGAVCARLLPTVMEINLRALRQRAGGSQSLARYDEVACILTGDPKAIAEDGVVWVRRLCESLRVRPLAAYGVTAADFPVLIEKAAAATSMRSNPVPLTSDEMREILTKAL